MSDPADSPDPEDDPEPYEDDTVGRDRPEDGVHQTNFFGDVTGPTHIGSGHIFQLIIQSLSPGSIKSGLDPLFRWSEASPHARTSWAGMLLWSMSAVADRISLQTLLWLLVASALWLLSAWLLTPILQWPLDDPWARLIAITKAILAGLLVPLFVASFTQADNEPHFHLQTKRDRFRLWLLKFSGAIVGFGTFFIFLLLFSLFLYYLTLTTLPDWGWWLFSLLPLFFSHVAARRIPADRHEMFGGELRLHPADRIALLAFALYGFFVGWLIHTFYDLLTNRIVGAALLLSLIGIVYWKLRKQATKRP